MIGEFTAEQIMAAAREGVRLPRTEMTSLVEIKSRLAAIEQGQAVLCERLDGLLNSIHRVQGSVDKGRSLDIGDGLFSYRKRVEQALDEIRGALLLQQFRAGASKTKKRGRK